MAAPEAPPAPQANFVITMPVQQGNTASALVLWQSSAAKPRKFNAPCPVSIDSALGTRARKLLTDPAVCEGHAHEPEWHAARVRLPGLPLVPEPLPVTDSADEIPPACTHWAAAPAPQPVETFLRSSAELQQVATPRFIPEIAITRAPRPVIGGAAETPAAEPVADFLHLAVTLNPLFTAGRTVRYTSDVRPEPPLFATARAAGAAGAEAAARFVTASASLDTAVAPGAVHVPLPRIDAEIEPLPVLDETFEIPAMCREFSPSLIAEAAARFLSPSVAPFHPAEFSTALPALTARVEPPHVPFVPVAKPAAAAEAVMTGVWPKAAAIPISPIAATVLEMLPALPDAIPEEWRLAPAAQTLAAEVAESFVFTTHSAVPALAAKFEIVAPAAVGPAHFAAPAPAGSLPALQPAALESLLVASHAAAMQPKQAIRLPKFAVEASEDLLVPCFDPQGLTTPVHEPLQGLPAVIPLHPVSTIHVAAPEPEPLYLAPSLPAPGMLPVEFHAQRTRGQVYESPQWKASRLATVPPRFTVRPVFEKLGETPQQPKPRPEPTVIKTFAKPGPRKPSALFLISGRIAAGLVVASMLWYGIAAFRGGRSNDAAEIASVESSMPATPAASSGGTAAGSIAAPEAPKGFIASVRQTIAKRASLQAVENFHGSMRNWGATDQPYPAGWSRHKDGYIQTGSLALFLPSVNFRDYRFEFFGQIENKGMSWTVRAKDQKNYHAMKVAVVEAGLRPFIALVHWDVVDGKPGRPSRTPLNVMVHNNRPIQVAVNVEGNHLITSIDGEEVDTFTNDTLASGGVGFFSEANEKARLYWMRVSKNDDWLGHVCAFLSGDANRAIAVLRGPGIPGSTPWPWNQGEEHTTLAAASLGLPYLRRTRRGRASNTRRITPWNT